jgi:zinc protease
LKFSGVALVSLLVATFLLSAGSALATTYVGSAAEPNLEPVFYPLPDNAEVLHLENGLQVIFLRNPAQPMVGVFTQVKVGSAREDFRTSGMSHMLEHLLFNGSEKYSQEEQYDMADRAGAYNNANTTDFFTNFMMVAPAGELDTALELQSEMLFHSIMPEDKFAKEKGIVLGELVQARDYPGYEAGEVLRHAMYAGSSLALPTLGTRSTIAHMERDDVFAFYKKWYVPNNMVLTMSGNFDRDQALELLRKYYGEVPPGPIDDTPLRPAPFIERTRTITRKAGDERILVLSFEAPTYGMDDYFPYEVLTQLLGLDGTGIVTLMLEDMDPEIRPEFSYRWQRAQGFGRLILEFTLKPESDPTQLYRALQDNLAAAVEQGINSEDILGIVRMSETSTLLEREQLRMTGIYIAEPVALGGADFFLGYLERLRQVRAEDVSLAVTRWLVGAPCLAVLIEPAREQQDGGAMAGMEIPEGMKMPPAMMEAMRKMQAGDGAAEAPETGNAEQPKPVAPAPLKVDRSELANGAVLVSQTNPDSPLMAIHLTVRGRAVIDQDNAQAGALDLVHRMLGEGYAGCDRACLARELRNLGAVIKLVDDDRIPMDDYYTNGRFSFIRIECAAANGPALLELLTKEIQHASFDDQDFEQVRGERVAALQRRQASARRTANAMLDAALYGDHPLVLPPEGSIESLQALDYNQTRMVYRKAFLPENLIFSIVGPVPHDELKAAIEEHLPGRGSPANGMPVLPVTAVADSLVATVGGELTAIRLGSIFEVASADKAALELAVAVLSDRMAMDLREARGLSYSVGASVGVRGDRGEFTAWLNPPTERKQEGRDALVAFLQEFDPESITQEEMDKIRSARSGRRMMRRLSSMGQAYYLAMAELEHDIPGYLGALAAYDDLELTDLQRVFSTYLQGLALVEVVVD